MPNEKLNYDVIIIGAGGAGMMCGIQAGKRGRKVLILDHATKPGGKILISGGGRCNFTNIQASPRQYQSQNPHFCKSALTRFPSESFVELVREHGIGFHEKKLGQLFCDESAKSIVELLRSEAEKAEIEIRTGSKILKISRDGDSEHRSLFSIESTTGSYQCQSLVIATGGLSIPKIGATGFGYEVAKQFGLNIVKTAPALDGFTWNAEDLNKFRDLAGVSVDCNISCNGVAFRENILFTHGGLSGPAALQASLHWNSKDSITLDLLPDVDSLDFFLQKKKMGNKSIVKNLLSELLPNRFADRLCELYFPSTLPLPQVSEKRLEEFSHLLHHWEIIPSGTVGYNKAEVTRGGVDTAELSSKTMEAKKIPGLYFIGEVVDVTGWLGGYNFQWAWASGWAAGQVI